MSYLIAGSLEEALTTLRDSKGRARVVSGATDLFLRDLPYALVDITAVKEMAVIEESDQKIMLGAAVSHSKAANSSIICRQAKALSEASLSVGSPQIRNIGTLGGNVVNAAPAADAATALVALGAKAVLVDIEGQTRVEAVESLYESYNRSYVDSCTEILLRFEIESCSGGEGTAFTRFASRRALSLPMVNAAARIKIEGGFIKDLKLVAAPVRPAPTRLTKTEMLLKGMPLSDETWQQAEKSAADEVEVRSSLLRCSADYRSHLVGVMTRRALVKAVERALGREEGESS